MVKSIDRKNTKCLKWDLMEFVGGSSEDIPMWIADMDFACEGKVLEAMQKRLEHPVLGYTFQTPSYREAMSGWYKRQHGMDFAADWFLPCLNVLGAMQLIADQLLNKGDKVFMFTPIYPQFYGVMRTAGAELVEYPLYGCEDVDWEKAEELIARTKAVIFCNPHNPLARVWSEDECRKLVEICRKHDVFILSDEVHGDMAMFGHTYRSIAEFEKKCIVFTSAAKTFNLAGLGGAALIIPDEEVRENTKQLLEKYYQLEINAISAEGIEAAYTYGDQWLAEVKEYIEGNAKLVLDYIGENLPKIKCTHQATFLMWLDMRGLGKTDINVAEEMKTKAHVLLDDGVRYGASGAGFIRMNIALSRELLTEALERLKNICSDIEEN